MPQTHSHVICIHSSYPILVHWKLTILGLAVPYSVAEVSGRNTLTFPPALTYEAPPTASDDVDATFQVCVWRVCVYV